MNTLNYQHRFAIRKNSYQNSMSFSLKKELKVFHQKTLFLFYRYLKNFIISASALTIQD